MKNIQGAEPELSPSTVEKGGQFRFRALYKIKLFQKFENPFPQILFKEKFADCTHNYRN